MAETRPAPPHGRYRRGLEGANFTLECNTESVPADGRFYVLRETEVVLATSEFEEATAEYHKLCRDFWRSRLQHPQTQIRISAAWGLLGLDPADKIATAVIAKDGTAQERKRLEQAQSRRRALRARAASEAPAPAAPSIAANAANGANGADEAAEAEETDEVEQTQEAGA
jgi:hypothetical protein